MNAPVTAIARIADMDDPTEAPMKPWMCANCGWVYDQALGDPDSGIARGTSWEDVPETWACPDCGARKSEFDMVEL